MPEAVVIDERFCGPPNSANGGYACGLAAQAIDGPASVTLRVPPPLGRALAVERGEDGQVSLVDGDIVVANARPSTVHVRVPEPVSLADARSASSRYPWRDRHPYPTCFVCGPAREADDGLSIFPGPVDGRPLYAAPWTPDTSLEGSDGTVRNEFIWAALDCPSGIVTDLFGAVGRILLGRLDADLRGAAVKTGSPYVVVAWPLTCDGRKLHTASALLTDRGEVCAVARAVWIEVRGES